MNKDFLDLDQCKELESLGFNIPDEAPAYWLKSIEYDMGWSLKISKPCPGLTFIPTMSLQGILEMFKKNGLFPKLVIDIDEWSIEIGNGKGGSKPTKYFISKKPDDNPIDVAFEALKWCIINKYI